MEYKTELKSHFTKPTCKINRRAAYFYVDFGLKITPAARLCFECSFFLK